MKKSCLLLLLISFSNLINSQVIDNNIQGYYQAKSDSNVYSFFEFDGNGKVNIVGLGTGDYFTKGDSLIIYPDKSIFKFKIKNNILVGVSNWVKNETWIRKDTIVTNNRKDTGLSRTKAVLLYEYYKIADIKSEFDLMLNNAQIEKISRLCNQGLSKACMDYFGILLMKDQGLGDLSYPQKNNKRKSLNPEIIAVGNKIIAQGEPEGHTLLGTYYYMLGKKKEAKEQWNIGISKGSQKSGMALIELE